MINIPERVKDALRSGEHRKNYKISAYNIIDDYYQVTPESYHDAYWGDGWRGSIFCDIPSNCNKMVFEIDSTSIKWVSYSGFLFGSEYLRIENGKTYFNLNRIYFWDSTFIVFSLTNDFSYIIAHAEQTIANIDNNNLVSESVKFDERMCSDTELKFGLCEGTSIEFQYFDKPSILGARINIELDVEYIDSVAVGWDDIQSYSVNGSGISEAIIVNESRQYKIYVNMSNAYSSAEVSVDGGLPWVMDRVSDYTETFFLMDMEPGHTYVVTFNNRRGSWSSITLAKARKESVAKWYTIPMGYFDVIEISRQASTGIMKATAYNKLMSKYLDSKINADLIVMLDATASKSMPMYELLQLLTEGFAIEKPTGKKDILGSLGPYISGAHGWGIAQADSTSRLYNGKRYMVGESVIRLGTGFNRAYYYEFIINTVSSACENIYQEYLQRTGNPWVWCEETQSPKRLSDYIAGNYAYSKYFGGYFELETAGGITEYLLNSSRQLYDTGFINNVDNLYIHVPTYIYDILLHEPARSQDIDDHNYPSCVSMDDYIKGYPLRYNEIGTMGASMSISLTIQGDTLNAFLQISESTADQIVITESQIAKISDDITLRDLQSAVYELNCQYGKLDRVTDLFAGIELNNGHLYPHDGLYPHSGLYPQGIHEAGYPSMYSKLWADEGNVRSFKYLIITYKAIETIDGETQEVEKTLQRTVNANGTDNYNMSDNWLFRNLIWTSQQVGAYADAMVTKMQNIRWFPFEMWCAGLPFLEAGDAIEINMKDGVYPTYILRRTLSGIQNLQDEMINGTLDIF